MRASVEAALGDLSRDKLRRARASPMIELDAAELQRRGGHDKSPPPPLLHVFEGSRAAPLVTPGNRCLVACLPQVKFLLAGAMRGTETQSESALSHVQLNVFLARFGKILWLLRPRIN